MVSSLASVAREIVDDGDDAFSCHIDKRIAIAFVTHWTNNGALVDKAVREGTLRFKKQLEEIDAEIAAQEKGDAGAGAGAAAAAPDVSGIGDGRAVAHMIAQVEARWGAMETALATRRQTLAAERTQATTNDGLCRAFADAAAACHQLVDEQAKRVASSSGEELGLITSTLSSRGRELLEKATAAGVEVLSAGVDKNPHTTLSIDMLKTELESAIAAAKLRAKVSSIE